MKVVDWTLDGTRLWWCKVCRRFTEWEFRSGAQPGTEEERCTECRPLSPGDAS